MKRDSAGGMYPRAMDKTTAELIEAARAGRRDAVEVLLQRHEGQVYRFSLRMCGNPEDAKEVLQETLVTAFKGIHQFRGEAELSTWLYQVARSFCIKARRRRVGEPTHTDSLETAEVRSVPGEAGEGPDSRAHAREVGEVLQAALASLPDHYREVILLKDVEGLSAEEVAEVVGENVAGVKSRLHRARLELRRLLSSVLDGDAPDQAPCPALAEELAGYAGGDIDQTTCEQMEAHMKTCPQCTAACDRLKDTVSLCRRVEGDEVPAPIRAAVLRAVGAAAQP